MAQLPGTCFAHCVAHLFSLVFVMCSLVFTKPKPAAAGVSDASSAKRSGAHGVRADFSVGTRALQEIVHDWLGSQKVDASGNTDIAKLLEKFSNAPRWINGSLVKIEVFCF